MHARRYPPADYSVQWFTLAYPGTIFDSLEKLVVHTTETSGWPSYNGGAVAPNLTARPDLANRRLLWRGHFPVNMASRALVHLPGQTETNRDRACQVELIGTCNPGVRGQPRGPGMYWPDAPGWALQGLADLLGWLGQEWDVPPRAPSLWLPYDASAGNSRARLSRSAWDAFRGVLGHQHVPENDHGDPGDLKIARVFSLIPGGEMAITDEDATLIMNKIMNYIVPGQKPGDVVNFATLVKRGYEQPGYNTGLIQKILDGQDMTELVDQIARAVVAALPPAPAGSLTFADVKRAVREVLVEGTGGTP